MFEYYLKPMDLFQKTVYQISNITGSKSKKNKTKQNKNENTMRYSSRKSPIENSLSNYNQIYMIICKEYIAKSFISGNGKIKVK